MISFCFSVRGRKVKSIHLRSVGHMKSAIAHAGISRKNSDIGSENYLHIAKQLGAICAFAKPVKREALLAGVVAVLSESSAEPVE